MLMMRIVDSAGRTDAANRVLELMTGSTRIFRYETPPGGYGVSWTGYHGNRITRRWQCRGQDFYPVWHRQWGHGGTMTTALSQLIRWCQHKPMLPLSTWRYWCGDKCKLGRENGPAVVQTLFEAGYPETAYCVLCGEDITSGMDWWSLNGVSGPCCGWTSGCRQKPKL